MEELGTSGATLRCRPHPGNDGGHQLAAWSTSAAVLPAPRLKRTASRARAGGSPSASSTGDGARVPELQAAPLETATPSRSSPITTS